jgi:deoxyribose-phosphate aldolase
MKLSPKDIASMIDISAVQASHGETEILELVKHAKEYGFIAVHALPCWTRYLHELLSDRRIFWSAVLSAFLPARTKRNSKFLRQNNKCRWRSGSKM